jgi:serine/threonine-protein phosphatase 2B catalytic subunit
MDKKKKIEVLKHKIRFIGKVARIWKIERQNKELVLNLKQMCPDGKIPPGTLIQGKEGLTDTLKAFMLMKDLDRPNEAW